MRREQRLMMCMLLARRLEWEFPGNMLKLAQELDTTIVELRESVNPPGNVVSLMPAEAKATHEYFIGETRRARQILAGIHHTAAKERPEIYGHMAALPPCE
jgi:hypothetical protein